MWDLVDAAGDYADDGLSAGKHQRGFAAFAEGTEWRISGGEAAARGAVGGFVGVPSARKGRDMTKLLIPEAVFDQHIIVLGKTRSGKSSAMRLLVEHLLLPKKKRNSMS